MCACRLQNDPSPELRGEDPGGSFGAMSRSGGGSSAGAASPPSSLQRAAPRPPPLPSQGPPAPKRGPRPPCGSLAPGPKQASLGAKGSPGSGEGASRASWRTCPGRKLRTGPGGAPGRDGNCPRSPKAGIAGEKTKSANRGPMGGVGFRSPNHLAQSSGSVAPSYSNPEQSRP